MHVGGLGGPRVTTTLDVELAEAGDLAGAPLDLLLTDAVKGT
jgi:hypothetical protein